ncbi:MAG: single-stranded DNA-binding protein [Chloroflexota bacterium]
MYQQITLIGNLGADPEMRYTGTGTPVTSFRMAVSRQWTGQDGQRQEKTTWFRVTCWRRQAEIVSQYLTKGSKVLVVGEMEEPNAYMDRDGNPRASLDVTAQTVRFLNSRNETATMGGGYGAPAMGGNQMGGGNMGGGNMGGAPSMAPMQQQPAASQYPVPPQQPAPQQAVPQQPIQPAAPAGAAPVLNEEDIPF